MTYAELLEQLAGKGNNLAEIALGSMMAMVEEDTGTFPSFDDKAPKWVIDNCLGRS